MIKDTDSKAFLTEQEAINLISETRNKGYTDRIDLVYLEGLLNSISESVLTYREWEDTKNWRIDHDSRSAIQDKIRVLRMELTKLSKEFS
jgi:hypothetical protein